MRLVLVPALSLIALVAACGGVDGSVPIQEDAANNEPGGPTRAGTTPAAPPTTDPGTTDPPPTDPSDPVAASTCFQAFAGPVASPNYDPYGAKVSAACTGTRHQKIAGVEKVVFLGDSVTAGTPPTAPAQYYRTRLTTSLKQRFGANIEVSDCSVWGARTNDLLGGDQQLSKCFPSATEPKKTLVVMTLGGNDVAAWAKAKLDVPTATARADEAAGELRAAIDWLKDPARFPAGVDVVFANVYEFTDTSGDLASCPTAGLAGFSGSWAEGAEAIAHLQERFLEIAVQTKTDMIFMMEHFCGRGFRRGDASLQCYRGPNAPLWFDLTCIHPTPEGHAEIASLFMSTIDGL